MAGGTWDPTALKVRPGLYINFEEAAAAQISGGARGTVAMNLFSYAVGDDKAANGKVYTIETLQQANDLFVKKTDTTTVGDITSIEMALQAGAKKVLVYTGAVGDSGDVSAIVNALEGYDFNVFVFDGKDSKVNDVARYKTAFWIENNMDAGKHFMGVFGRDDDTLAIGESTVDSDGNSISYQLPNYNNGKYIVQLVNGVVNNDIQYNSQVYAPYIAGLIATTPINKSITYQQVPGYTVNQRFSNAAMEDFLNAGALVMVHDGNKVKVEQGITMTKDKIRAIRARQAVSTDISNTAKDSYIGKLDNSEDGQKALVAAIKAYLERLETASVLTDIVVTLDAEKSINDQVFVNISYRELDSMERIFITIDV
ncbi:phage tail sheath subtilisin-like domain-containing protein [Longirhabdus pacifica]|uniref:phage tail sheath subtilisin-like domain-containing protein n=1 Tax=Longirhabdus pacifica TaxID=2305227 RepID=UPI0010093CB8|nr:phage tail sheath subtilisin-like domain-containing protein [Longirhabdus pacifica]